MSELVIWTLDWVPDGPRGFVRDMFKRPFGLFRIGQLLLNSLCFATEFLDALLGLPFGLGKLIRIIQLPGLGSHFFVFRYRLHDSSGWPCLRLSQQSAFRQEEITNGQGDYRQIRPLREP